MDSRQTLHTNETFMDLLKSCYTAREKVYVLVDEEGITRTEGFITAFHASELNPSFVLDHLTTIAVQNLIAVNGIFRPEYGEC